MDKHEWPHRSGEWNLEVRRTAKGVVGTATVEDLEEEVLRLAGFKEVLEQITLALGCMPTQFPDAYGHVLQRARDLVFQAEGDARSITMLLGENRRLTEEGRQVGRLQVKVGARLAVLEAVIANLRGHVVWHRHDGQTVKLVAVTEAEESIHGAKLYVCYEPDPEGRPS